MTDKAPDTLLTKGSVDVDFRPGSLLPDPEPRDRYFTVISVDDHLVEPAHMFEGRLPSALADRAPRIVERSDGAEVWHFEGLDYPQIALGASAGRPKDQWAIAATRYSDVRPGCYDPAHRIKDMDIDGVYASLNFPSLIAGFAGGLFYRGTTDPQLGHALVRAWNDWFHEEWAQPYPDRIIPCGLTWLGDPDLAAAEVRRNAERGFKALSFLDVPSDYGLPSLYTGHWDPLLRACEETQTVICLHAGSGGFSGLPAGSPWEVASFLFPITAARATLDWVWSRVTERFPGLQIALSGGGIGWVPTVMERLAYVQERSGAGATMPWTEDIGPVEVLKRNFNFCSIEFTSGMDQRDLIGTENIMVETDYPHSDSSWPDTQELLKKALTGVPDADVERMTWRNASELFRHPVPDEVRAGAIGRGA
jgi:predicted TIM-barrel fold metal-dependent hydrolase